MRKPRKQQQATARPETSTTGRRWTALEKSRIVRQHLRDGVAVADLAEQTGAAPGLIYTWIKLALERLEAALDGTTAPLRKPGRVNLARVDATTDAEIARPIAEDPDTAPEFTDAMLQAATVVPSPAAATVCEP